MKALIAVDGSEGSWEAVRQTGALLNGEKDQVAFFYAAPTVSYPIGKTPAKDTIDRAKEVLSDAVFSKAVELLPVELRERVHRIVGGKHAPHEGVLLAADDWRADLIAVGARGVGPIPSLLLGSVSKWVVQHASVPVLVARARPAVAPNAPLEVLVACGHDRVSEPIRRILGELSWPADAKGRLMHVVEPPLVGKLPPWLEELAKNTAAEPMAKALVEHHEEAVGKKAAALASDGRDLPSLFKHWPPLVVEGHAAETLLKTLLTTGVRLVVVGARNQGKLQRLVLGSTWEKLLNHADCSVLVVKEHEKP